MGIYAIFLKVRFGCLTLFAFFRLCFNAFLVDRKFRVAELTLKLKSIVSLVGCYAGSINVFSCLRFFIFYFIFLQLLYEYWFVNVSTIIFSRRYSLGFSTVQPAIYLLFTLKKTAAYLTVFFEMPKNEKIQLDGSCHD